MSSPESRAREGCPKCGGRGYVAIRHALERLGFPLPPCPECGPEGRVTKLIREAEGYCADRAPALVSLLFEDMNDRCGFHVDSLDPGIRASMRADWEAFLAAALRAPSAPSGEGG